MQNEIIELSDELTKKFKDRAYFYIVVQSQDSEQSPMLAANVELPVLKQMVKGTAKNLKII